jgi:release factor glutamine methyltransferase
MMIKDWLNQAYDRLKKSNIEAYQTECHWILEDILKLSPAQRRQEALRILSEAELKVLDQLIEKRSTHIPLAYLLHQWSFWDFEVISDQRALIPRADTECLVEKAIAFLQKRIKGLQTQPRYAIEVGVGTGCISIALAKNIPQLHILGLDLSLDALSLAQENISLHQLNQQIQLAHSDLLELKALYPPLSDALQPTMPTLPKGIDLLISNPPYIQTKVIDQLMPEVRDFEPKLALDGGEDGLALIRILLKQAKAVLAIGGAIMLEIGYDQGNAVKALLAHEQYEHIQIIKDYQGQDRVAIGIFLGDML